MKYEDTEAAAPRLTWRRTISDDPIPAMSH